MMEESAQHEIRPTTLRLCQLPQPTDRAGTVVNNTAILQVVEITYLRTVAAAVVETVHAPPAMTFLHELHFQMPTAWRFTES